MVEVKTKSEIKSRCGLDCDNCEFQLNGKCPGCLKITKPFWDDSCPIKSCCEIEGIECCGQCESFPCDLLKIFSYDEEQGDNGQRIENCKKWCYKNKL